MTAGVSITSLDFAGGNPLPPVSDYTPLELTRRVAESFSQMTPWGWPLFWQAFQDSTIPGAGGFPYKGATGTTTDRQYGRDLPFFWTEVELRGYRVMSRYLCETNSHAIGFLELLTDYHIGTGYGWQACLKGHKKTPYPTVGRPADPLVAKAQQILDEFRDREHWAEASAEAFTRWRRDGEAFGRTGCAGYGKPIWYRVVEPEQVGTPDGATDEPWSYGIDVLEYEDGSIDSQTPLAYHLWDLESGMTRGQWVEACEITHVKANVDSTVKRGRPDFFPLVDEFDGVRRLLRNMLTTAVDQAAIAWIEQYPTATLDQVRNMVPEQVTAPGQTVPVSGFPGVMNPFGGGPWQGNGNKFRPGTVIKTEGGRQFGAGPTSTGTQSFVAVEQAVLRALGSRWRFPEYFSGDASNNNMASSIVAGGPFVQGVKRSQTVWGDRWERPIACRVLDLAVAAGKLTREERARLDVEVMPPSVVAPKPDEDATRAVSLVSAKLMSIPTAQQQLGLDPQHEAENMKAGTGQGQPGTTGVDGGGDAGANDLRGTVGGLQAIGSLQQQFYAGEIPQAAAIASLKTLFGFSDEEAAAMFPAVDPVKRADDGQGDQGGGGLPPGLFESLVREGFTGTDANGHHWVNGKQVATAPKAGGKPTHAMPDHPAAEAISGALSAASLPPDKQAAYSQAAAAVLSKIPPLGLDRAAKHVAASHFYESARALGLGAIDRALQTPGLSDEQRTKLTARRAKVESGQLTTAGAYVTRDGGQLHLDGGFDDTGYTEPGRHGGPTQTTAEVYAHEFGHAIDGPQFQVSNSARWQEAYAKEIGPNAKADDGSPRLTRYAHTNAQEGLAEFCRLVYGGQVDLAQVEKEFPIASKFFKEAKLWPS